MATFRKVQVWIAWGLLKEQKKILIFKLIEKRGGGWHPVTGSVEEGESFFEGAIRETAEETTLGAHLPSTEWMNLDYSFQFKSDKKWQKGTVEEHSFGFWLKSSVKLNTPSVQLDPTEHTEAKWVNAEEALMLLSFPNQKAALEIFLKKLL